MARIDTNKTRTNSKKDKRIFTTEVKSSDAVGIYLSSSESTLLLFEPKKLVGQECPNDVLNNSGK